MPYRYIEEEATADIAFEATGEDLSELFKSAGDAVLNVMVANLESVRLTEARSVELDNEALDLLLLDFLQDLIFYKDAEQLLLRANKVEIQKSGEIWHLSSIWQGEQIDPTRHHCLVDVKAVTLHDFRLEQVANGWRAHVILDI
jgi:SHS2 domain-containing protein